MHLLWSYFQNSEKDDTDRRDGEREGPVLFPAIWAVLIHVHVSINHSKCLWM